MFPGKSQKLALDQLPDSRVLSAVALLNRKPRGRDWFLNYDLEQAKTEPPSRPAAEPRISIWLDRMKIQDGEGRGNESESLRRRRGTLRDAGISARGRGH